MTATVAAGKMHLDDLAGSLGQVVPIASAYHISFQQIGAALATLTVQGIPAQNAARALGMEITQLGNEAPKGAKALALIGLSSKEVAAEPATGDLQGTLQLIEDHLSKKFPAGSAAYDTALKAIMGAQNSFRAGISLMGPHLQTFKDNIAAIGTVAQGAAKEQDAWNLVQQDATQQWEEMRATLESAAMEIGLSFLPALQLIMADLMPLVDQVRAFVKDHKELIASLVEGAAKFFLLVGAILTVVGAVAIIVAALNPVSAAIIAFGAAWATNFLGIRDRTAEVVTWVIAHWPQIRDTVVATFNEIKTTVDTVLAFVVPRVQAAVAAITKFFADNRAAIATVLEVMGLVAITLNPVLLAVVGLALAWKTNFLGIRDVTASLVTWFGAAWPQIQATVETVMAAIQTVIQDVLNAVAPFVQTELNQITDWWINNHALIQQTVTTVMTFIRNYINEVLAEISAFWKTYGATITATVTFLWTAWKDLFSLGFFVLLQIVKTQWENIKIIIDTVIHVILDLLTLTMQGITGDWKGAWSTVQDILATTWSAMGNIVKNGVNLIIGFINDLIGAWDAIHLSIPGFSITLPSIDVPGVGTVGGGNLSWGGFSEAATQIAPIPTLDSGGIVSHPMLALLAMNSQPEVVAPLSSMSAMLSPGRNGTGHTTIVYVTIPGATVLGSLNDTDISLWGDKLSRYLSSQWNVYGQHP